jgi:vitamin B12 transporter
VKRFAIVAGLAGLPVSFDVLAEESVSPVIVTATRTAQTADEALAAVTVITREQIEASQAKDVAELLRFEAGIDIGRNGGPGQQTSVFLRGTDSNHTLVLIDGVRINPGTIGAPAWQNIDPATVDRIEIVRGPRSTLYGSDAIGGVIQIFTRRATPGTRVTASAGGGTFDSQDGAFGVHQAGNHWRAGADVSRQLSDGYPARIGATTDSGYDNTSVNAYGGLSFSDFDAEISHWQASGRANYHDFFLLPVSQDYSNRKTALAIKAAPGDIWVTTLRIGQARDYIDQVQSNDFAHTDRTTFDWQNDLQLARHNLLTLGAYKADENTDALSYGTRFDVDTETRALYAQDQLQLGGHSLLAAWRTTRHETFSTHHTGELSYGYQFSAAIRAYASYGTAFRAPDSTDRFGDGGNPDLHPETAREGELGIRWQPTVSQQVRLHGFLNNIDDLISYQGVWPTGIMTNIDRARIHGVELGYTYQQGPWRLNALGVSQNPENLDTGRQLARRAANTLTLSPSYTSGDYGLGGDVLATSSRWDSDYATTRMPGYAIVSIFAQYRLAPDWQLRARIENLFDQPYTLAEGYQTMGRAMFVRLEYGHTSTAKPGQ